MKRATTSLPVPDSPVIRTVVSVGATLVAWASTSFHFCERPSARCGLSVSSSRARTCTRSSRSAARSCAAAVRRDSSASFWWARARATCSATPHGELAVIVVEAVRLARAEGEPAHGDAVQADGARAATERTPISV